MCRASLATSNLESALTMWSHPSMTQTSRHLISRDASGLKSAASTDAMVLRMSRAKTACLASSKAARKKGLFCQMGKIFARSAKPMSLKLTPALS